MISMTASLPKYKASLAKMADDALGRTIHQLATQKREKVYANTSYHQAKIDIANVNIIRLQRQLQACFEECVARENIGLYVQNYVHTRLNPLCPHHPDPEKLAYLHMAYKFPG